MFTRVDRNNKSVLIIDDMEGMRKQLHQSLFSEGFARLDMSSSVADALERMSGIKYDIILCDYTLGDNATNGQQFLEYLRNNSIISTNTTFIMITAEQSFSKVIAASEFSPDDYLLKPFTPAQFNIRLGKVLQKKQYFSQVDAYIDNANWLQVVVECDKLMRTKDQYFYDLCKVKGLALLQSNQLQQAADFYSEILLMRPLIWAKFGLAKAWVMQGVAVKAVLLLDEIQLEQPTFMASYDLLAQIKSDSGDEAGALVVLKSARKLSPGRLSRIRETCRLAVATGQSEFAETVMRETLEHNQSSPVLKALDYVLLAHALMRQEKLAEALSLVHDGVNLFADNESILSLRAMESILHKAKGDLASAEQSLSFALEAGDPMSFSIDAILVVAEAYFSLGRDADADRLLRYVIQNNVEDMSVKGRVRDVLVACGKNSDEAIELIGEHEREVEQLSSEGVNRAKSGQFDDAIELLCAAADRLPNNVHVLANTALVMAFDLMRNGHNQERLFKCLGYRAALRTKSPNDPNLSKIDNMLQKLKNE